MGGQPAAAEVVAHELGELASVRHVYLVEDDEPWAFHERDAAFRGIQLLCVGSELGLQQVEVGERIAARLDGRAVDDMDDHRAALDVPEELQTEASSLRRSGDEAGHVGDRVALLPRLHHPEVRDEGRERIVGDLGSGRGHGRDERRLAGARESDEGDVRHRLELEDDVPALPLVAQQGEARRLPSGRRQRGVAEPSAASPGHHKAVSGGGQIPEHVPLGRSDDRSQGHLEDPVLAVAPGPHVAGALGSRSGLLMGGAMEGEQRSHLGIHLDDDVAAVPPVRAVGPRERLELLTPYGCASVAARTGLHVQDDAIDETDHGSLLVRYRKRGGRNLPPRDLRRDLKPRRSRCR